MRPQDHQPDEEAEVPHAVHDERLVGRGGGRFAFDVEANQEVTADTDQLPEDKHHEDVARQHQSQHREAEQREKGEEAVEPPRAMEVPVPDVHLVVFVLFGQLIAHVAHGEEVNAGRDEGDHGEHHQGQAVDVVVDGDPQITETGQRVERVGKRTVDRAACIRRTSMSRTCVLRSRRGVMPQGRPTGGIAPEHEGREAADKRDGDAGHREVRRRLALSRAPVAAKDLDGESAQGQQPGDHQQAAERGTEGRGGRHDRGR